MFKTHKQKRGSSGENWRERERERERPGYCQIN